MFDRRLPFRYRVRPFIAALPLTVSVHAQAPSSQVMDPAQVPSSTLTQSSPGIAASQTGSGVQQQQAESMTDNQEIIVTGSHIARPTLRSPIPVTTLSAADLTRSGNTNLGDVLVRLPALSTSFNQAGSTAFIGTSGLDILDLRSLGQARTLVLVNGHRHITSQEGEFLVDINTIPNDLIERVDVVTGGSSAAYGSDAMAGVVNFVLKQNSKDLALTLRVVLLRITIVETTSCRLPPVRTSPKGVATSPGPLNMTVRAS